MGENPSESLRSLEQILHAFGKAAAQFSTTRLRVVAFRDGARDDGLARVPTELIPKNQNGEPVMGQLNIGGTGKATIGRGVAFYGIGGGTLLRADGTELNVGFVLYGPSSDDEAASAFRELGNEAGVIAHVYDLVPGILNYDNPLVLWVFIVYASLQGSNWMSAIDVIPKASALHFHPFTASVETLKRLANGGRDENLDEFIERLLAGPDDVELTPRELALLEAYLKQPVSLAQMQREAKAEGKSASAQRRNKLKLIRDFNRNLRPPTPDAIEGDPAETAGGSSTPTKAKRSTERGEGRAKLIAALTKHHKYADGGCLNLDPIGNNELARRAGVDQATASAFFKQQFKGHGKYKAACADAGRLAAALKLLNGEFAPHLLFGAKPPDEDERDEQ